ncbi:MAG: protein disulfide oxidoreductase [Promethearchaeota archaeon]
MSFNQERVKDLIKKMDKIVHVKVFTDRENMCPACNETVSLIREIAKLAEKIEWEEVSLISEKEKAESFHVSRTPTVLLPDVGIRYTGAPIGLETSPFIETLMMISSGETPFGDLVLDRLKRIKKKASLICIVTPTCPYCAQAVLLENSLAILSEKVSIEIVESYENPDIARKYGVSAVPVTIINEKERITGVPNVALLINKMIQDNSSFNEIYG